MKEVIEVDEYLVDFLKKTSDMHFVFSETNDEDIIQECDIVCKLPEASILLIHFLTNNFVLLTANLLFSVAYGGPWSNKWYT